MNLKIKNALVSVSDKEKIEPLLKLLKKFNIKIISSGGTFKSIRNLDINALNCLNTLDLKKCSTEG